MSVEPVYTADGTKKHKVRWREGEHNRARTFARKKDADEFDQEMKRLKATDGLIPFRQGEITLADYASEWWNAHAMIRLGRRTLDVYELCLDNRIGPLLGDRAIRDVTPLVIEDYIARLRSRGVGSASIVKDLGILRSIFKRAARHGLVTRNPVELVDVPRAKRLRTPVLLTPENVEAIRSVMLHGGTYLDGETERRIEGDRHRDAALVSLLAYSGPRPESEGVTLTWERVHKQTLVLRASKKHGAERSVGLLDPLAEDLSAWRLRSGGRRGLVFPASDGDWQDYDWRNWQRRIFKPACRAAGLPASTRARDLRGSFASLLIWSGLDILQVAEQLGHSPETCWRKYAQAFKEVQGAERVDAGEAIRRARGQVERAKETG